MNLYTSDYPYTEAKVFDAALGDHNGFLVVGRYIFAQRTDNGVQALYVSDKRKPFQKAMIPTPYAHERYDMIEMMVQWNLSNQDTLKMKTMRY